MTHKRLFEIGVGITFLCLCALAGQAQVGPMAAKARGDLPAGWQCTVESVNISSEARGDGSVQVGNVPADQGLIRLRATCRTPGGATVTGQSTLKVPVLDDVTEFETIDFASAVDIPSGISVDPQFPAFEQLGQNIQLSVTATLDGVPTDVTDAAAITYVSINSDVVSVNATGLLTSQANGTSPILVFYEGRVGVAVARVLSSPVVSIEATPASVVLAPHSLFPEPSAQLTVEALLGNGDREDFTAPTTGTTYTSSDTDIAEVTDDGLIVAAGINDGTATITVENDGHTDTTTVEVKPTFTPAPVVTYNTGGGFARNVDISGAFLYVADGTNGLLIFELGEGYRGKLTFGAEAYDVKVRENLAVVGLGHNDGVALVDVSDPAQPQLISRINGSGGVRDLWISGDLVFTTGGSELKVYDISDPAAPALEGAVAFAGQALAVAGDSTRRVAVALVQGNGLAVIQMEGTPWESNTFPFALGAAADDVFLLGTRAYVSNGLRGARIIDISNPAKPQPGNSTSLAFESRGIAVRATTRGTLVAAADRLFVDSVPLFNPDLQYLDTVDFGGDADAEGIALGNGFGAVAVGGQGIKVFSIDDVTDNAGTPPTVALTRPVAEQDLEADRSHDFLAIAQDDVAVDRVEFFIDGTLVATDSQAPYRTSFTPAAGAYTLRVEAVDGGGNRAVSPNVPITVTLPPVVPVPGGITNESKISNGNSGFLGAIGAGDRFGAAVTPLGDVDGLDPSVQAIAVGTPADDDGGTNRGAVWVVFLDSDGLVLNEQKISDLEGGFTGVLDDGDQFGQAVAGVGDLNGDGVPDLAVGAPQDDDGALNAGAAWILFLNTDGTVASHRKISAAVDLAGRLDPGDEFGTALAFLSFLGGSDNPALAVGSAFDDDGTIDTGGVFLLDLATDGTATERQKISATEGGFGGTLAVDDCFGCSLAALGDLDGDSIDDLAIGAFGDSVDGFFRGAVWITFLNADGTVKGQQKISDTQGGFTGVLNDLDLFGASLAGVVDVNDDNVRDLIVGAYLDDDGGGDRGGLWSLFLNPDGTVAGHQKISSTQGGFSSILSDGDQLGIAAADLGDLDGDGLPNLAVGADADDDGASDAGAVWLLDLDGFEP